VLGFAGVTSVITPNAGCGGRYSLRVLLDVSPLGNRDYRFLFIGQFVSAIGSFVTYVALPVQIYALTRSSAVVGLLGTAQLVPLALTALWGGAVADAINRRTLLLWC